MTHDPNRSQQPQDPNQQQPQSGQYQHPPEQGPSQPYPPQFGGRQQPAGQGDGPRPPRALFQPGKDPFGASSWMIGGILAVLVLANTISGNGEGILIILGLAAALTGLIAMGSERRTWANLPSRKVALAVCLVGAASVLVGSVAAGMDATNTARAVAAAKPATSAELEADAAAALTVREDAVKKFEADSTAKLKAREDAVAAREAAIGPAEKAAAASAFKDGTWTVGLDITPGTYRTTEQLMSSCYWAITKTGSNGGIIIENENVDGGFPMVTLAEGQTFESSRCGSWAKQ